MTSLPLVVRALRDPACVAALVPAQWDVLVRQARAANVLASLGEELDRAGMLDAAPPAAREHVDWARVVAERQLRAVHAEVRHIHAALAGLGIPLMLLKGAAYVMADLPSARGRIFSDIDVLVPKARLADVEAALMMAGWISMHNDAYDQRYYRTWMHELPPMQHMRRETVIDVHHAIVPDTAPVHPDPVRLLATARVIDEARRLTVLSPADMVLHSAVHLFHDSEFDNGLRDLLDLHRLLRHFGAGPGFWPSLAQRAQELELARPLFYALRYATRLFGTEVPAEVMRAADAGRPNAALLLLMDALFLRCLVPDHATCAGRARPTAKFLLYIRANWLRMPPLLLARHLFHKAFLSPKAEAA